MPLAVGQDVGDYLGQAGGFYTYVPLVPFKLEEFNPPAIVRAWRHFGRNPTTADFHQVPSSHSGVSCYPWQDCLVELPLTRVRAGSPN